MVAMCCRLGPISSLLAAILAFGTTRLAAQSLPIEINRNHTPAGVLRDGVLRVRLEIAKGEWHPEADDGLALSVYAFGEAAHPLQNPGPLIRVPQGTEHTMHDAAGMGQMVLGITVPPPVKAAGNSLWHADRKLQLVISERGESPRYALQLYDVAHSEAPPGKPGLLGPPIVLTRGEPVEIEVVNRLKEATAIHWHGIELESYYDGVPGWSGAGTQITPPIAPRTSFIARMTPPRAGTFIYHTHWHDPAQLTNGIYGPLIVLPPGEAFDPASDLVFVFSIGDFGALHELALINGTPQSKTLQLQVGKKYRFRLINISTNNQGMQASLRDNNGPVEWRIVAKDGAELPSDTLQTSKAQLTITVGETYDVEFSTATARDLLLDLLLPGQKIHTSQTLSFVRQVRE